MIRYINNDNRRPGTGRIRRAHEPAGGGASARQSILTAAPLLRGLSETARRDIGAMVEWTSFEAGAVLLPRHGARRDVILLASGTAHVINDEQAERRVVRAFLHAGDLFGATAALSPAYASSAVVAASNGTLGTIPHGRFLSLLSKHGRLAKALLAQMTQELRAANENMDINCLMDARQRLAFELGRLAETDPADKSRARIHPAPAQNVLADKLCLARQTVAKLFGEWRRAGIIERRGRSLVITNPNALEKIHEN